MKTRCNFQIPLSPPTLDPRFSQPFILDEPYEHIISDARRKKFEIFAVEQLRLSLEHQKKKGKDEAYWVGRSDGDDGTGVIAGLAGEDTIAAYLEEKHNLIVTTDLTPLTPELRTWDPDFYIPELNLAIHGKTTGTGTTIGGGAISLACDPRLMMRSDAIFREEANLNMEDTNDGWSRRTLLISLDGEGLADELRQPHIYTYRYISVLTKRCDLIAFCTCNKSDYPLKATLRGFFPLWWLTSMCLIRPQVNALRQESKVGGYWSDYISAATLKGGSPSSLFVPDHPGCGGVIVNVLGELALPKDRFCKSNEVLADLKNLSFNRRLVADRGFVFVDPKLKVEG